MAAARGAGRERLDELLVARALAPSRSAARALILAGQVRSRGVRLDKAGVTYPRDIPLELVEGRRYVSRAGSKLAAALEVFAVSAVGRDVLDVGASTGGFTQVWLEAGARRVVALDVGRGQLDSGLRRDERVHPVEGVNARYLRPADLPFVPSLGTVDVSFISLRQVLPAVVPCLAQPQELVVLVKPQFEVGRADVGRGGIVREPRLHERVLSELTAFVRRSGWGLEGLCASPLRGAEGNREFFLHLKGASVGLDLPSTERRIGVVTAPAETDG